MCNNHSCRTYTVKQRPFFALGTTDQFDKDTWLLRNSANGLRISSEFVSSGSKVASINTTMKGPETSENTGTPQKTRVTILDYSRKVLENQQRIATKNLSKEHHGYKSQLQHNRRRFKRPIFNNCFCST